MQNSLLWLPECGEMLLGSFLGHFKCIVWLLGVVGSCQGVAVVLGIFFLCVSRDVQGCVSISSLAPDSGESVDCVHKFGL